MRKLRHFIYVLLLVGLDQLTKYLAVTDLKGKEPVTLIQNVLQLRYHENDGAVWGILGGKTLLLLVFTFIILLGVVYVYLKLPSSKRYNGVRIISVFMIAGAIGNMIDRLLYHYVIDFIYIPFIDFPIFNVADCYISICSFVLILLSIFYFKDEDFEFLSRGHAENK